MTSKAKYAGASRGEVLHLLLAHQLFIASSIVAVAILLLGEKKQKTAEEVSEVRVKKIEKKASRDLRRKPRQGSGSRVSNGVRDLQANSDLECNA
ncbi:MAG: hypothetical protein GY820_34655, partial [Gammaproteobacteria bacterium]|nr:hypothetical protein [Gammaproteobacteria bacterium]